MNDKENQTDFINFITSDRRGSRQKTPKTTVIGAVRDSIAYRERDKKKRK